MTLGPQRYTPAAIALHWIAAILILCNLTLGLYMTGLELSPQKLRYISWHKWIGVTVLLVSAARLLWRLEHEVPALPWTMKPWEQGLARAGHFLLYVLFFAAPISGWLFSSASGVQVVYLGLVPLPDLLGTNREVADALKVTHHWINYTLAAVILLHAAAALKHHFVDRDEVLARMIPFLRRSP